MTGHKGWGKSSWRAAALPGTTTSSVAAAVTLQVWSSLPTAEVLAQAAANTVRPALNTRGAAYAAAVAAGLDPQLLYDYRCRVLNMVKAHYGGHCFFQRTYVYASTCMERAQFGQGVI
jgi:hypothetical protein